MGDAVLIIVGMVLVVAVALRSRGGATPVRRPTAQPRSGGATRRTWSQRAEAVRRAAGIMSALIVLAFVVQFFRWLFS